MAEAQNKPTDESIKDTLQSIVIAFVLAFLFRAYVVEAFVIPTGSMAPTLLGAHLTVNCRQCGYSFTVDTPRATIDSPAVCPMCRFPNGREAIGAPRSGDRIMVQKYIYDFVEPRRWDVVVFNAPHQPAKNYIKRLAGLPGEELAILDGNLYVKPNGGKWHIARKTDRPAVQRRVLQPIYHSQYRPLDNGEARVITLGGERRRTRPRERFQWAQPWVPATPQHWQIADQRRYAYDGQGAGWLRFDFSRGHYQTHPSLHPYNQYTSDSTGQPEPIEDIRLATTIEPAQADAAVKLQTTARLGRPEQGSSVETLTATVGDRRLTLEATDPETGKTRVLARHQTPGRFLRAGESTQLELWFIDQEAIVWVDGEQALSYQYDLPLAMLKQRGPADPTPKVAIHLDGPGTLHRIELDRDLYYTNKSGNTANRAGLYRVDGGAVRGEPFQLDADQYFCLGDNSPASSDSRFWGETAPWIRQQILSGDHEPGVVPGELMVGRAFFVYWPASYSLTEGRSGIPFLPNFGDMRFIK